MVTEIENSEMFKFFEFILYKQYTLYNSVQDCRKHEAKIKMYRKKKNDL